MSVKLCTKSALKVGQMRSFVVDNRRILLVRSESGYHAIDEMCSHEDYSLALGCIQGERIKCSLHGSRFDLVTGAPLDEPACDPIAVHRLHFEGEDIYVDLNQDNNND